MGIPQCEYRTSHTLDPRGGAKDPKGELPLQRPWREESKMWQIQGFLSSWLMD